MSGPRDREIAGSERFSQLEGSTDPHGTASLRHADVSDHLDAGHGLGDLIPLDTSEPPPEWGSDDFYGTRPPAGEHRALLAAQLLTVSQLADLPPVRPLIDGLLYRGTLAQLSGPPGCYKSFLAIAWACAVATGVAFEGHPVPGCGGPVVYVAAEGASGLRARILAWCELSGVDSALVDARLRVLPVPVQLNPKLSDVAEITKILLDLGAVLLVLDTRARCTIGLEENSATEQGRAIAAADTIIRASGATVLALHHSSRSGTAGRGSTAWDGAVWSDLRMTGEHLRATLNCSKHKDVPDGCEHALRLVPHTVATDHMPGCSERERSTLVIMAGDERPAEVDHKTGRIVSDVVSLCAGPDGLTRPQIRDLAVERGATRSRAYAAINKLVKSDVLINVSTEKKPRYVITGDQRSEP